MASRISAPSLVAHNGLERIRAFIDPEALRAIPGDLGAYLWPADRGVLANIIRLLWVPWWVLSDLPGPAPYARVRIAPPATPVAKRYLTILGRARRIQILYRFLTALIRGLILTAAVGCLWSLVALVGGSTVTSDRMTVLGIVLVAISLIYAWWYRPGLRETAVMIDRSFRLDDRLTTAVDHVGDAASSAVSLPALQQIEAINTLAILSKRPALRIQAPIRELVALVGLSLLLLALYLLNGAGAGLPALGSGSVPAFVAAKDRLKPTEKAPVAQSTTNSTVPSVQDVQQQANLSASAEQDLLTLADALDDNPLTAPIADSIRAGNYDQAAAELAAIAPQLDQLSPDLQNELADNLDTAADAMSGDHPDLQQATHDAADALHGDQPAADAVSDLSTAIKDTGASITSQQDLSQEMKEAREAEASDAASRDTRPEPADNQASSSDGEQQIAGDGGDAASGSNEQAPNGQKSQNTGGSGSDGQDQSDAGSTGQPGDQPGSGDDAQQSGSSTGGSSQTSSSDSNPGDASSSGSTSNGSTQAGGRNDPSAQQSDGSNADSDPGSGAGKGDGSTKPNDSNRYDSNGASQKTGDRSADSPDPNVNGDGASGSADSNGDASQSTESITLSRSPDAPGYESGGSSSSSSGSGSGAASGPGTVEQGDVGEAGPDSNRVPDQYKSIVKDYFSDEP